MKGPDMINSSGGVRGFLAARQAELEVTDPSRAAALYELLATHRPWLGVRTDLVAGGWWRRRPVVSTVCVFCSEVVDGRRTAWGWPCPALLGAAGEFEGQEGWQAAWRFDPADWG